MATKFNLNRQPVPDEEINSHKDFGELVKEFKKQSINKARSDTNFFKNKKITYSAIIAGATVICTVTYFSVFKNNSNKTTHNDKITTSQPNNKSNTPNKPNKAFIAPPISKLNVPYQNFTVKSEQGATLVTQSQSKIKVPKNAFVNKSGQNIVGDVEIKFREFHDQADIIASGIPMRYDSAGIKSTFESAGMIEIKGYQNNEPVFINPKKQITVELQSSQTADKYNMYILDTIAKNWTYLQRDNSLKGFKRQEETNELLNNRDESENNRTKSLQKQIDAIPVKIKEEKIILAKKIEELPKATQPYKPIKANPQKPQFQLDVDAKEFPELATFKNMVFEVGAENKNYKESFSDIVWNSAQISEGTVKGQNYLLTLKHKAQVETLLVYPALMGKDYDNAIKTFDSKFNEYKTVLAKRQADEKKLKEEFEKKQVEYIALQAKLQKEYKEKQAEELKNKFNTFSNSERVIRVFMVSSFGIYNSDCPHLFPIGETIKPSFLVNNQTLNLDAATRVYVISKSKNLVFNYGNNELLKFVPNELYSLCVIINNEIYLCNEQKLTKIRELKQDKIAVQKINVDISNVANFKKALGV